MDKFNKEFDFEQAVKELKQCDISELKDIIREYEEEKPTETQEEAIKTDLENYNLEKPEMLKALKQALEVKILGYDPKHRAAAQIMDYEPDDVTPENYNYYGLTVFQAGRLEYAAGTEEEANKAVKEWIENAFYALNPELLAKHTKIGATKGMIKAIKALQEDYEEANEAIMSLIVNFDDLVTDAINEDGRGRFLSPYDSEEKEIDIDGETFYAYRLN